MTDQVCRHSFQSQMSQSVQLQPGFCFLVVIVARSSTQKSVGFETAAVRVLIVHLLLMGYLFRPEMLCCTREM